MDTTTGYTARNRMGWNAIASARAARLPPPEFFATGNHDLDQVDIDAMGSVADRRLLHLCCAHGSDTLSWAVLGAHVTGVDISERAIEIARQHAAAAGIEAEFRAADVYELPDDLRDFDIVYTGCGAVCWLPNLPRWADAVAGCLRPGGTFHLYEHHPLWETLIVDADGARVTRDYFSRGTPCPQPIDHRKAPSGSTSDHDFVTFQWPMADVITALVGAGLRITLVEEYSAPAMYGNVEPHAGWLPATYLVRAVKERHFLYNDPCH